MKEGNRPWGFGMGSEDMNLVTTQRMETALNSQRVYQTAEQLHQQYRCSPSPVVGNQRRGDSGPRKTARPAVSGFAEPGKMYERERFFGRGGIYGPADNNGGGLPMRAMVGRNTSNRSEWGAVAGDGGGSAGEGSEEDDEDDDEDEDDGDGEMEGEVDGMVSGQDSVENNTANGNASNPNMEGFQKGLDRDGGIPKTAMQNQHQHPSLGMFLSPPYMGSFAAHAGGPPSMLDATSGATSGQNGGSGAGVPVSGGFYRDGLVKEAAMPRDSSNSSVTANTSPSLHEHHQARIPHGSAMHSEGPIAVGSVQETDHYYTQLLHSSGPLAQKDPGVDEGSAYGEKKGMVGSAELSESSLRNILSDPLTGALMDDATILSCGHSFGSGGLQHVLEARACITCGQPVTNDSIAPNHALRAAVQAYRREEEFQSMSSKSAKRRRDKFEQDKVGFSDPMSMDCSRGKGVQFPFVVSDRVIIKGNKRTPERFVGREAVITTQCLNGWYVVKTLDNAETVKLQYRSLLKVGEHQSSNEISHKGLGPSWL